MGVLCSFKTLNFNIYIINDVQYRLRYIYCFHNLINKLFLNEIKVPRAMFEARKVAGTARYKQSKYLL